MALDPAVLDMLRRSLDLRLDAQGRWFIDDEPIANHRVVDLFDRGLDVHPDTGEAILRVGDQWCYIKVDDTPFVVRRLRVDGDRGLVAHLNNGEVLPVPGEAFSVGGDDVVYLQLTPTRRARLGRSVQQRLADWLVEGDDGAPTVEIGGRRWTIATS